MYSGTVADFSGSDPIIYREPLQTEQYDSLSLNGKFLGVGGGNIAIQYIFILNLTVCYTFLCLSFTYTIHFVKLIILYYLLGLL